MINEQGIIVEGNLAYLRRFLEDYEYADISQLKRAFQRATHLHPINTKGLRGEAPLTEKQIMEIRGYAKKYRITDKHIIFKSNDDQETSNSLLFGLDLLYINTDIMPAANPRTANSSVTWQGAIAHELEGHRAAALSGNDHADLLIEEVQASMRASIFGKYLTPNERQILKMDTMEILQKAHVKFNDIKHKLWLEEY